MPIDRENAFMLYAAMCGDLERTAHALNISPVEVLKMADDEKWNDKLKSILELKKSSRPGDIERAINRAMNFVQAHRMRLFLERVIVKLTGMNETELTEYLFTGHSPKDGTPYLKLSTRALADLMSALEKAHALSYQSLSDTAQDRSKRVESDDGKSGGELHAQIAEAMRKVGRSRTPRAQLFDAQLQIGEKERQRQENLEQSQNNPLDNDDH